MSVDPYISLAGPIYAWLYFATIMATMFYGFTCMQVFFYFVHYENDPLRLKIFVTVIWTLNTIYTSLTITGAYKYIAAGLANPSSLLSWVPELSLQIVPTALVAVLSQGFLMHRIYVFSGKKIVTMLLWFVLSILQLVASTAYIVKALYSANRSLKSVGVTVLNDNTLKTMLALSLSVAAVQDILIAIFLVYLLVRERTITLLASTAHMMQRLTILAVNTGAWTATFALLSLIFLYVSPSERLYLLFAYPICSIYCNTVLSNLNVRLYLGRSDVQHDGIDLPGVVPFSVEQCGEAKLDFAQPEDVQITTGVMTSTEAAL